jgi:predicted transcriptional regulator
MEEMPLLSEAESTEAEAPVMTMDEQTRAAIREGVEQARRGEFVPDAEIEALWKQHDL